MSDDIDRTDEYAELIAEDQRQAATANNGHAAHIPPPDEPPDDDPYRDQRRDDQSRDDRQADNDEPTTWEPIELGPWMNGEITQPEPSLGIAPLRRTATHLSRPRTRRRR